MVFIQRTRLGAGNENKRQIKKSLPPFVFCYHRFRRGYVGLRLCAILEIGSIHFMDVLLV